MHTDTHIYMCDLSFLSVNGENFSIEDDPYEDRYCDPFYYGFTYFRQKKDPKVERGYIQVWSLALFLSV